VARVPYSPLGHGFLTGTIRSIDDLADSDWRKTNPRFTGENFERNLRIAEEVQAIAAEAAATPAQVALAWLLAKDDDIAPFPVPSAPPGSRRTWAADTVVVTAGQIARLDNLPVTAGDHHNETKCACSNASPSGAGEARARALVLNV
jgi:aryl-alcohol dehydrogenase-like predicted oxidoreductase